MLRRLVMAISMVFLAAPVFAAEGPAPGRRDVIRGKPEDSQRGQTSVKPNLPQQTDAKVDPVFEFEVPQDVVLVVHVVEAGSQYPIGNAYVSLRHLGKGENQRTQTDSKGMAQFELASGKYLIRYVEHPDYIRARQNPIRAQPLIPSVSFRNGNPASMTVTLEPKRRINVKAFDPAGNPVGGASVTLRSVGELGKTDAAGAFNAPWKYQSLGGPCAILIRHPERNLAAMVMVIPRDPWDPVIVTLTPGVVIAGKVVDPEGKPVPKATVRLRCDANITLDGIVCDEEGKYEIRAVPPDREWRLFVSAEGYGSDWFTVDTSGVSEQRIEVKRVCLAIGNMPVSGKVVDSQDRPVAYAYVWSGGYDGWPFSETTSDKDGRFRLEGLFKGPPPGFIHAAVRRNDLFGGTMGTVEAEGGATDVVVKMPPRHGRPNRPPPSPPSLVGHALPHLACFEGDAAETPLEGRRVLVCFWYMHHEASTDCLRYLASKADLLEKEGVTVLAIHAALVDVTEVEEWASQAGIPFPVGMVGEMRSITGPWSSWHIGLEPYLVLADRQHTVVADDFDARFIESVIAEHSARPQW